MFSIVDKNKDFGVLLGRLLIGCMMLSHGLPKLMKLFAGGQIQFADPIGVGMTASLVLAVFSEVVCSILIILGLKMRLALVPLIATMGVAAFIVHAADPFGKKEKAILYLVVYIILFFTGAGRFSVDKK